MHVEIQVALNFLISFLYNKLPRRRVNQFGEELEIALKAKFAGHWYPNQPAKGSAYRCLKTANPLDPVFEIAARNCGLELADVQEYLPSELTIWVEPGEVSYRMSEKSPVKLLYQENEQTGVAAKCVQSFNNASEQAYRPDATKLDNSLINNNSSSTSSSSSSNDLIYNSFNNNSNSSTILPNNNEQDQSTSSPGTSSNHSSTSSSTDSGFNDIELAQQRKIRSFNPEAQCFKPIESSSLLNSFNNNQTNNQFSNSMMVNNYSFSIQNSGLSTSNNPFSQTAAVTTGFNNSNASAYFQTNASTNALKSPNNILPAAGFTKQTQTMTTAQFAQTKFGSTKLKTTNNSSTGPVCGINGTTKRNYTNRMSPTEFSNYIKQKALLQQQQTAAGINSLSQSLNGHQLQVPNTGANNFGSLFNSLSPQQSRSISPISNQDNFLLMAAAAASTNQNQISNNLNNNLMRTTLSTNNTSSISGLNSSGNSICSSLSSNSGSTSLKLMLNNNSTVNQNLLSPSSNSAPSGENLLSDINYLSGLFNNTSLSPILGNSASLNNSSPNVNAGNALNSVTINTIKPNSINRFNSTPTSFLDMNANNFTNYSSLINKAPGEAQFSQTQQEINNQAATNQQQQNPNQANQNNQNSTKSNENNDKQFDSYSMSNGVIIYPNQYQHLLVAN